MTTTTEYTRALLQRQLGSLRGQIKNLTDYYDQAMDEAERLGLQIANLQAEVKLTEDAIGLNRD